MAETKRRGFISRFLDPFKEENEAFERQQAEFNRLKLERLRQQVAEQDPTFPIRGRGVPELTGTAGTREVDPALEGLFRTAGVTRPTPAPLTQAPPREKVPLLTRKEKVARIAPTAQAKPEDLFINPETREISTTMKPGFFGVSRNTAALIAAGPAREAAKVGEVIEKEKRTAVRKSTEINIAQQKSIKNLTTLRSFVDEYFEELDKFAPSIETLQGVVGRGASIGLGAIPGVGGVLQPDIRAFNKFRGAIKPKIARALGDVGNLSIVEQKSAINLLSGANSSTKERENAKLLINSILFESENRAIASVKEARKQAALSPVGLDGGQKQFAPGQSGTTKSGIKFTVE